MVEAWEGTWDSERLRAPRALRILWLLGPPLVWWAGVMLMATGGLGPAVPSGPAAVVGWAFVVGPAAMVALVLPARWFDRPRPATRPERVNRAHGANRAGRPTRGVPMTLPAAAPSDVLH